MTYADLKDLIGSFGFPIFIAVWLLWERRAVGGKIITRMDHLIMLLEGKIIDRIEKDEKD